MSLLRCFSYSIALPSFVFFLKTFLFFIKGGDTYTVDQIELQGVPFTGLGETINP